MEKLVKQATSCWSGHRDIEDLVQLGRIAYWKENCSDDSEALAVVKIKRRVIDGWRSLNGRGYRNAVFVDKDDHTNLVTCPSSEDECVSNGCDIINLFDGKKRFIAHSLIMGFNKHSIAHECNVHPSRVSQILAEMKVQIGKEWINV